jgi:ATP-dependent Clp protease adaptor protein ClpS
MATTDIDIIVDKVIKKTIKEPGKFKVVVFNDNVTTMEFVIALLMTVFKHPQNTAMDLTQKIHNEGKATAGIYRYEIAEQKVVDATNLSEANGFPLVIRMQPE